MPACVLRDQVRVQLVDELALGRGRTGKTVLAADPAQQLERRERRNVAVGGRDVGTELGEKRAQQRGLAGADLTGDADEAARLGEAEPQMGERLGVLGGKKEVARIRRQPKWLFLEPEELLVHASFARPTDVARTL